MRINNDTNTLHCFRHETIMTEGIQIIVQMHKSYKTNTNTDFSYGPSTFHFNNSPI